MNVQFNEEMVEGLENLEVEYSMVRRIFESLKHSTKAVEKLINGPFVVKDSRSAKATQDSSGLSRVLNDSPSVSDPVTEYTMSTNLFRALPSILISFIITESDFETEQQISLTGPNPGNRASSGATLMQRKLAIDLGHVIREGAWVRPRVGVALSGTERSRLEQETANVVDTENEAIDSGGSFSQRRDCEKSSSTRLAERFTLDFKRTLVRVTKGNVANMAPRYEKVILCRGVSEKTDSQEAYVKTLKTAGLILTSQRAAEAIGLSAKEDDSILHPWRTLPVYCVGPATESFAKSHLGSENCFGKETGNAKELAELLMISVTKRSKPLLYPCSEIGRETLEKILNENEIKIHKIIAYRTLPTETLERDLSKLMDDSPSTVEHVVALLKEKSYNMNNVKAVAIGPVTGQALLNAGLNIFAIANKPDPVSLLNAISNAEKSEVDKKSD
ncbi:Uroporphyrinogen-III synthase [Melipona quadrifasciata]|uniref:Uroporphyrinogen-III synthase n=1 Tax=Melipona quadrifasciata TaxID=166423 RepID=A0A0M9A7I0_9HYME|nr:Uroporphyrinogen-III synthase [Melipona quadrifasciata]